MYTFLQVMVLIIPPLSVVTKKDEIEVEIAKIEDLPKKMNKDDSDNEMRKISLKRRKRRGIEWIGFYFII